MDKKTKIGENLCTHKPQPGVEYNSLYMDNRRQRIESVKTIHDVNVPWEFKNQDESLARNRAKFKCILGYITSF